MENIFRLVLATAIVFGIICIIVTLVKIHDEKVELKGQEEKADSKKFWAKVEEWLNKPLTDVARQHLVVKFAFEDFAKLDFGFYCKRNNIFFSSVEDFENAKKKTQDKWISELVKKYIVFTDRDLKTKYGVDFWYIEMYEYSELESILENTEKEWEVEYNISCV